MLRGEPGWEIGVTQTNSLHAYWPIMMARRVASYFVFIGIVFLAVAFVLALGKQPSGRMLMWGLGALLVGVWLAVRAGNAPTAPPPPPPVAAQAKESGPAPAQAKSKAQGGAKGGGGGDKGGGGGPPKGPVKGTAKPKRLAGLFQPRTKSRT